MDLSTLVDYSTPFAVEIKFNDKPINVQFFMKSLNSKPVRDVDKAARDKLFNMKHNMTDGGVQFSSEAADLQDATERPRIMAATVGWQWNGNGFGKLGNDPEFTKENLAYVLDCESTDWLLPQLFRAAANIANFTKG